MPDAARYLIKTSFLWLALGLGLSAGAAAFPHASGIWPGATVYPASLHLLTVGWLTQLIFGVAFWLFPRWSRERPHGPAGVMWLVYGCLNVGLLLRLVSEPYAAYAGRGTMLWMSAALQAVAGVVYAVYIWKRVKVK